MTTQTGADFAIFVAYALIAMWCALVMTKRGNVVRFLFFAFIGSCGITHFIEGWYGAMNTCAQYSTAATVSKVETAIVSLCTAAFLVSMMLREKN